MENDATHLNVPPSECGVYGPQTYPQLVCLYLQYTRREKSHNRRPEQSESNCIVDTATGAGKWPPQRNWSQNWDTAGLGLW